MTVLSAECANNIVKGIIADTCDKIRLQHKPKCRYDWSKEKLVTVSIGSPEWWEYRAQLKVVEAVNKARGIFIAPPSA